MKENTILEQLRREALYAQRSFSTELLYETHGMAKMRDNSKASRKQGSWRLTT